MKHSSTRRIFGGLAALVAIMIAVGTAQGGAPWYWDGSVNEWNANYSADPLNNHWLTSFDGPMNDNLPGAEWANLYINAGKVTFTGSTLRGDGQFRTQASVSGGVMEWNSTGTYDPVYAASVTGTGKIVINAGTFQSTLGGSGSASSGGEIVVNGGSVPKTLSAGANGYVTINGGTVAGVTASGGDGGGTATVTQTGGTVTGGVTISYRQHWGNTHAYYYLGDATGNTGAIDVGAGTVRIGANGNWPVGNTSTMTAVLRGHGTITAATLDNNRSVIADGYGADRTLDLSGVTTITNSNMELGSAFASPTDGWYAVNGGKLLFPTVTVTAGASAFNVGDNATDAQNTLINSVNLAFTNVAGGDLSVALRAPDRTDLGKNAFNADNLSLYDFDASGGFDFGAGSVVLTFRYDNVLAASLGLTEADLNVWHRTDTAWVNVTASVDTANYLITTMPMTSFSMFATAFDSPIFIPEPTSLAILGLGGLALLKRRARRA